jgi:hypothetical protein
LFLGYSSGGFAAAGISSPAKSVVRAFSSSNAEKIPQNIIIMFISSPFYA